MLAGGSIGADSRWAAALGAAIVRLRAVPDGVPFAAAPTHGWENTTVAAQLVLHGIDAALGARGFILLQAAAVGVAFALLAADARRLGATGRGTVLALALVFAGATPALMVMRIQAFSLVLFPLLLVLLRSEATRPTRRAWLILPLLAVWSNLHGAVLVGFAAAAAYLVVDRARRRPLESAVLLGGAALALGATPAGIHTWAYFRGVLRNEAARRGTGMWSPLTVGDGWHVLFLVALVLLVGLVLRARVRPRAWEAAAALGLLVLTIRAERSAPFLLFLIAAFAARGVGGKVALGNRSRVATVALLASLALFGVVRGPLGIGATAAEIDASVRAAGGRPILADGLLGEQIVRAGGRIWVGNPIDAFRHDDQRLYLDWLEGARAGDAALARVDLVLVPLGARTQARVASDPRFSLVRHGAHVALYVRRATSGG